METTTLSELYNEIQKSESDLEGELLNFWHLIKIIPIKWDQKDYSIDSSFWVVAICGKRIIWYNDVEGGFNISEYTAFGTFDQFFCEQDEFSWSIVKLYALLKFGGSISGQMGSPKEIF